MIIATEKAAGLVEWYSQAAAKWEPVAPKGFDRLPLVVLDNVL